MELILFKKNEKKITFYLLRVKQKMIFLTKRSPKQWFSLTTSEEQHPHNQQYKALSKINIQSNDTKHKNHVQDRAPDDAPLP